MHRRMKSPDNSNRYRKKVKKSLLFKIEFFDNKIEISSCTLRAATEALQIVEFKAP